MGIIRRGKALLIEAGLWMLARLSCTSIDFRRIWKMRIGQIPEHVGTIDGGVAVGDLDMPPAFSRRVIPRTDWRRPLRSYSQS